MNEQFTFYPSRKDDTKRLYDSANPYDDEDNALLQALNKKPVCIILLGKPCSGKTRLAKTLCLKWKLQHINELIVENINSSTESGKTIKEIMSSGQSLDERLVYNLISHKLESPECAHYGYVLDDLPTYSQSSIDIEEQIAYITSMNLKPDFIVHIKISNEDILRRREGLRIDVEDGTVYSSRNYTEDIKPLCEPEEKYYSKTTKIKQIKTEDNEVSDNLDNVPEEDDVDIMEEINTEDEEDQLEGQNHPDFIKLNKNKFEYLISRLEDNPEKIKSDIEYHEKNIATHVSSYITKFNPFNVIELDGNLTPTELFYNLLVKLQGMNLYPSIAPIKFYGSNGGEEDEDEAIPEDIDTDELFQTLATKKMPGPRARWHKSPWKRLCPVALYEGQLSIGKPEFTVGYLGQIFCLSNIANYTSFIKNPRPYLLAPQPKPPFRVIVLGPKASGKTELIHVLAESYRAKIIDIAGMIQEEYSTRMSKKLSEIHEEIEIEIIKKVTEKQQAEIQSLNTSKMTEDTSELAENEVTQGEEKQISEDDKSLQGEENINELNEKEEKPILSSDIPEHLLQPVDKDHPEVKRLIAEALQNIRQQSIEIETDFYLNAVRAAIDEAETKLRNDNPGGPYYGQWIIDGLPVRPDVWRSFVESAPELLPDLIVYLQDTSKNSEYLLQRWIKLKIEEFANTESIDVSENIETVIAQDFETEQSKIPEEIRLLTGSKGETALSRLKEAEKLWTEISYLLTRAIQPLGVPVDVFELSITDKTIDQMKDEVLDRLVRQFKMEPVAKTQADLDEEEEEEVAAFEEETDEEFTMDDEGMEEGEYNEHTGEELEEAEENEEEESDSSRNLQKNLGLTSYFCPVALQEYGILRVGDPDIVSVYQNLIYYFSTEEARSKFIENPDVILNTSNGSLKPPPPRILMLGPTGTGKSLHSRQIALNLNLVHIDFLSLLQEITFPKLGKKIGKQYTDQEPIPDIVLPPIEESSDDVDEKHVTSENEVVQKSNSIEITNKEEVNELDVLPTLDEHETNVYEYLLNSTPIPNDTLEWLLGKFWKQEPYKSSGFILDGFPQSVEDLQFLITSNYFFDFAIFLTADVDEVVSRLLPPRLEIWRKRMAKKAENANKLLEWKTAKKKLAIEKRRVEILKELEEKREKAKIKQNSDDPEIEEDEELEDEVDIDEMLAEEFADDEEEVDEEEDEETEADFVERLTGEITESFNDANDIYTEILEQIDELSIPKYDIDSGGKITWARYRIVKRLHNLLENRNSLFERVYPITPKIAERLLNNGYYFPSRYGLWCPVTLYFQDSWLPPIPMPNVKVGNPKYLSTLPGIIGETLPVVFKAKTCAAIYKQHIYWFMNPNARALFIKNPLKYTQNRRDPPFRVPLRLHILGAPKTGKSTIARRLAKEYNIPVVTAGDSIRWILNDPSHMYTMLANRIREQFNRGESISDELTAEAIQTLLMNGIYFTRGFILDNYPLTREQGELLYDYGVRPNLVIELVVKNEKQKEELIMRGITQASLTSQMRPSKSNISFLTIRENQRTQEENNDSVNEPERIETGFQIPEPEVDIAQELVIRLAAYDNVAPQLKQWYYSRNGILVELEAIQNRWLLWRKVIYLVKHRMKHVEEYMERITAHKAASVAELGIEQCEYEKLSSEFRQYCPVSLRKRQDLEDTINEPKHHFIIQLNINENQINRSTNYNLQKTLHNNGFICRSIQDNDTVNVFTSIDTNNNSNNALNNLINIHTTMRFTAEYEGHYYRMAGPNELKAFLINPTRYIPPNNMYTLPEKELIPVRLKGDYVKQAHDTFPTPLALNGYCPVCFQYSKLRYEGLKLGLPDYLVNYNQKIYTFCSNDCLLDFLRKPVLYSDLKLPNKLPPILNPITVKTLPLPGFLEQTLAVALRWALSSVGQERPKFPFITIKRSALIYMGLHLKAHNQRFPIYERNKYQQKLVNYMDACQLIPWLAKSMPIEFRSVSKRSMEFNTKLEHFLELERHKDLPETWIH